MLNEPIAKAIIDFMPLPILADLYLDETGNSETADAIRQGKLPCTHAECEAFLYSNEVAHLLLLSPVNLTKAVMANKYSRGFINYLLYHLREPPHLKVDFVRTRAVRAAHYGDPVYFVNEKVSRKHYPILLKIIEVLGRKKEKRALQSAYWYGKLNLRDS
jgi:hypothetical protein